MLFLVNYTILDENTPVHFKTGLFWGGRHHYVIEKVCRHIGYPVRFNEDCFKSHNEYEFCEEVEDHLPHGVITKKVMHNIKVSEVDNFIDVF